MESKTLIIRNRREWTKQDLDKLRSFLMQEYKTNTYKGE